MLQVLYICLLKCEHVSQFAVILFHVLYYIIIESIMRSVVFCFFLSSFRII